MKLSIEIELGNDGMQDGYDAYQAIAQSDIAHIHNPVAGLDGIFRDVNGNTVGTWTVTDDEPTNEEIAEHEAEVERSIAEHERSLDDDDAPIWEAYGDYRENTSDVPVDTFPVFRAQWTEDQKLDLDVFVEPEDEQDFGGERNWHTPGTAGR